MRWYSLKNSIQYVFPLPFATHWSLSRNSLTAASRLSMGILPSKLQFCDVEKNRPHSEELLINNIQERWYLVNREWVSPWRWYCFTQSVWLVAPSCWRSNVHHHIWHFTTASVLFPRWPICIIPCWSLSL